MARAAIAVLFFALSFPAAGSEPLPEAVPATVLRVIDGDTIEVKAHIWIGLTLTTLVRLKGIDAPELSAPCAAARAKAREARALVQRMTNGGSVLLHGVEAGKYARRIVARVTAGGADIAQALLAANLARPYDGGKRQSWCGE